MSQSHGGLLAGEAEGVAGQPWEAERLPLLNELEFGVAQKPGSGEALTDALRGVVFGLFFVISGVGAFSAASAASLYGARLAA